MRCRNVGIRPVVNDDLKKLVEWRLDPVDMCLWTGYRHLLTEENATKELIRDIDQNWHTALTIVQYKDDNEEQTGFVYSYDYNSVDGHCKVTTFIDRRYRRSGAGAIAHGLFLEYLFCYYNLRKVYADVYSFNEYSRRILQKAGYQEEGRLKAHRYWNGNYHDLYILALNRDDYDLSVVPIISKMRRNDK